MDLMCTGLARGLAIALQRFLAGLSTLGVHEDAAGLSLDIFWQGPVL
jgi:hypothetical protein